MKSLAGMRSLFKDLTRRRAEMLLAAAVVGVALMQPIAAEAQQKELKITLGLPENHSWYPALVTFGETLKELGIPNRIYTMSLMKQPEAPTGIRDGIVDIGMVSLPYAANELPELNLLANISMLGTSGTPVKSPAAALTGANLEYILLNCPECLEQLKAQNQVYISNASTTDYDLQCKGTTILTLEDLKGKRLRSGSGILSRLSEYVGATPVVVQGAETYDALDKGIVDCTMLASSELIGLRIIDLATSVTRGFPGAPFSTVGLTNINRKIWQGFTPEQRAEILRAGAKISAESTLSFQAAQQTALDAAREKGIEIHQIDNTIAEAMNKFVETDLQTVAQQWTNDYRLQNVEAKIELYSKLVEKWKGLTDRVGTDPAKLTELYWNEVYAKLDAATFGMD